MNPFPPLLGGQSQWVASMVAVRVKWGLTARLLRVPLDTGPGQHALLMWPTVSPGVFWKCLTWWALGKQGFEAETVTGNRWREWTRLTKVFSPLSMPQLSFPYFFKAEEMYKLLLERTALETSTFQLDSNLHFQLARCYLLRPTWNVSSARPPPPNCLPALSPPVRRVSHSILSSLLGTHVDENACKSSIWALTGLPPSPVSQRQDEVPAGCIMHACCTWLCAHHSQLVPHLLLWFTATWSSGYHPSLKMR